AVARDGLGLALERVAEPATRLHEVRDEPPLGQRDPWPTGLGNVHGRPAAFDRLAAGRGVAALGEPSRERDRIGRQDRAHAPGPARVAAEETETAVRDATVRAEVDRDVGGAVDHVEAGAPHVAAAERPGG